MTVGERARRARGEDARTEHEMFEKQRFQQLMLFGAERLRGGEIRRAIGELPEEKVNEIGRDDRREQCRDNHQQIEVAAVGAEQPRLEIGRNEAALCHRRGILLAQAAGGESEFGLHLCDRNVRPAQRDGGESARFLLGFRKILRVELRPIFGWFVRAIVRHGFADHAADDVWPIVPPHGLA